MEFTVREAASFPTKKRDASSVPYSGSKIDNRSLQILREHELGTARFENVIDLIERGLDEVQA